MKFEEVAKNIIKKSIRSAICIDDMFEEPFMSNEEKEARNKALSARENNSIKLDQKVPKELYRSFREIGECDLDIYNFNSLGESWRPNFMLNNKDLIVIDWELEGLNKFESTIAILKQAIETNAYTNVPFIIIYTHKPKEDFYLILKELIRNFNPFANTKQSIVDGFYKSFCDSFEGCFEVEIDKDSFLQVFEKLEKKLYEYVAFNSSDLKKSILNEVLLSLNYNFQIKNEKRPRTINKLTVALKNSFNLSLEKGLEMVFYLISESTNLQEIPFSRIDSAELGFKINSSIVTVFSKEDGSGEGVKPEKVFESFSNLICCSPHNFLTLLGIEMTDKLRDDSYKIGEQIASMDERAFFHHMNNYKKRSGNFKNEFFDFLLKSWTNEIESYNYNNPPSIFAAIENYALEKNHDKIDGSSIKKELGDLGLKLSTVEVKNRLTVSPTIRFGDIFQIRRPSQNQDEFLICITPLCVCVDVCKVDNNFYFIKSEAVNDFVKSSAAKEIETNYYSIIKLQEKVLAIKWGECKPFTLYIAKNDLNNLTSIYCQDDIRLKYIATSKENFAQRISNKAFSYGMSIGIDLPHI